MDAVSIRASVIIYVGGWEGGINAIIDWLDGRGGKLFIENFRGDQQFDSLRFILRVLHCLRWVKQLNSRMQKTYVKQ